MQKQQRMLNSPDAANDDVVRLHIARPQREHLACGFELDAAAACRLGTWYWQHSLDGPESHGNARVDCL